MSADPSTMTAAQWQVLAWTAILEDIEKEIRQQGIKAAKRAKKVPRQKLLEVARRYNPNVRDITEQ